MDKPKIILGIETSCDETAAAVLTNNEKRITILSNIVSSSAALQAKFGGVIPEQAAREQLKSIIPVIETALSEARITKNDIDAIAVSFGPGLIGSLLVGVETAKTLATVWKKPLIPVNHLLGHFYANWIRESVSSDEIRKSENQRVRESENSDTLIHRSSDLIRSSELTDTPKFPCLGLLISGGHTDLVLFKDHNKYEYLGGTRDDAAGECFDKCARLLNLPYPGGPQISKLAQAGNPNKFKLPIPMRGSKDFDFSYSGLKTAVANIIQKSKIKNQKEKADLAATIEATIVKSLIDKVVMAIQKYKVEQVIVAGGVAANQMLVSNLQLTIYNLQLKTKLHVPPPELCTDNAAMIASAAFFQKAAKNPSDVQADPSLALQ